MNLFDFTPPREGEEITTLFEYKNIKINRIVSAAEIESLTYRQKEDEWILLLEGEATLKMEEKYYRLKKGDTLFIPAETPHEVLQTIEGTLWLTLHIY